MFKLAQTDRPTDRPIDRAKTISDNDRFSFKFPAILKIVPEPTMTNRALICPVIDRHIKETNGKDEKNNTAVINAGNKHKIYNHIRIFHHGDWTINATESVNMKKAPPLGGHVFHDIIGTLYRVLKRSNCPDTRKNAPPPGAHVFEPTGTIFELAQDIILTNLLTKFHDDGQ
ncbi:hypothetical protein DPMN_166387 [Dreissena polymorpha]|uniref:Uncharacterized protein n=1 Tax=Dreissena polymorpha TaxID=45954 RepID=A0A9D4F2G0_DREPO|nr:hypothetical protein DPMN_166387 [Dreissena polymorpha]